MVRNRDVLIIVAYVLFSFDGVLTASLYGDCREVALSHVCRVFTPRRKKFRKVQISASRTCNLTTI
jgi:hypothetical protein